MDGVEAEKVGKGVWRLRLWKVHRPPGEPPERAIQVDILTDLAHLPSVMMLLRALAGGMPDAITLTQQ